MNRHRRRSHPALDRLLHPLDSTPYNARSRHRQRPERQQGLAFARLGTATSPSPTLLKPSRASVVASLDMWLSTQDDSYTTLTVLGVFPPQNPSVVAIPQSASALPVPQPAALPIPTHRRRPLAFASAPFHPPSSAARTDAARHLRHTRGRCLDELRGFGGGVCLTGRGTERTDDVRLDADAPVRQCSAGRRDVSAGGSWSDVERHERGRDVLPSELQIPCLVSAPPTQIQSSDTQFQPPLTTIRFTFSMAAAATVGRHSRAARSRLEPVEPDLGDMFAKLRAMGDIGVVELGAEK
ncbi:hypothetical protein C8F01DRAFT_1228204 [Mycena amicta]|nr:hypothetical protein C8F01DRAFT_1228204 [Mycena amicta]